MHDHACKGGGGGLTCRRQTRHSKKTFPLLSILPLPDPIPVAPPVPFSGPEVYPAVLSGAV